MDQDTIYDKWRAERSRLDPSVGFPDRVMQHIETLPLPSDFQPPAPLLEMSWPQRLVRIGVCAAAVLAGLLRVAELLGVFAVTGIEN